MFSKYLSESALRGPWHTLAGPSGKIPEHSGWYECTVISRRKVLGVGKEHKPFRAMVMFADGLWGESAIVVDTMESHSLRQMRILKWRGLVNEHDTV